MKIIDKDKVIAKIERLQDATMDENANFYSAKAEAEFCILSDLENFIDTIGTEDVKTWHRQSEKDIYDSFNDWSYHTFICLMDDGSVQKFSGICDECGDGTVNKHIDAVDDEYDDVDKIVYWIETPITLK